METSVANLASLLLNIATFHEFIEDFGEKKYVSVCFQHIKASSVTCGKLATGGFSLELRAASGCGQSGSRERQSLCV